MSGSTIGNCHLRLVRADVVYLHDLETKEVLCVSEREFIPPYYKDTQNEPGLLMLVRQKPLQ